MRNRILSWAIVLSGGLASLFGESALALTTLKQVQVSGGSQIDLLFDSKVKKDQIKTEFFNDIIQISLTEAAVYPAKISAVNSPSLSKIFAYQYAPKLVRCRLTVKGKAESFKDRIKIHPSGNLLTVRLDEGNSDQVVMRSAQAVAAPAVEKRLDPEEKEIIARVMKAAAPAEAEPAPAQAAGPKKVAPGAAATQTAHLTGAKPLPSPLKIYGKLAIVLGLFGIVAIFLKKVLRPGVSNRQLVESLANGSPDAGPMKLLSRFARNTIGRKEKMIEVLANHYLGPKKSISVVRIAGRTLVLGISNESINLITHLPEGGDSAAQVGAPDEGEGLDIGDIAGFGSGARAAGPAVFADLLHSEKAKPTVGNPKAAAVGPVAASATTPASVRAQIKNRLEGLKPL